MASESINRIKVTRTIAIPLPDPPKLSARIKRGVLTLSEAQEFDVENKRWFDKVQHTLKTQWFEEQ